MEWTKVSEDSATFNMQSLQDSTYDAKDSMSALSEVPGHM